MADTIKTNLGPVTAYADAKAHGYTGTREEFGVLLANAGLNLKAAETAKEGAEAAKQAAETAQQAAAENQKNTETQAANAKASADTAAEQAAVAEESAADAANSATAAQESETNAGLSATAAANAEAAAKQAQNAAETAKADAETAKTVAGNSADAAANSAADAKKTLESIPADYSTLSGKVNENASEISQLKEDLDDVDTRLSESITDISNDLKEVYHSKAFVENKSGMKWYDFSFEEGHKYTVHNVSAEGALSAFTCNTRNTTTDDVDEISKALDYGKSVTFIATAKAKYIRVYFNTTTSNGIVITEHDTFVENTKVEFEKVYESVDKKLDGSIGKNIYNKDTENQLSGYYFEYNSGSMIVNAGFKAVVVKVAEGDVLSFNKGNMHVCALSEIPDLATKESGRLSGYISGFADSTPKQGYTVPSGCVCLVVSHAIGYELTLQIEKNPVSTVYEPYMYGLSAEKVIGLDRNRVLYVGAEYATITDAVNDARDGDEIVLLPGTYTESVKARGKNIKIRGVNRDECILTYSASDYANPPLEMAKGCVEDMTIIATGTELAEGATYLAYCVHIDFSEQKNNALQFKNVRFTNVERQCVGIGLRGNYRLSFIGCEFVCDNQNCVYLHEEQLSNTSGQYVEFIDCSMERKSVGNVILMQESPAYENNHATVRFQRNILKNAGGNAIAMQQYGTQPGLIYAGYLGSKNWTLDGMSAMNNAEELNA